MAYPFIKLTKLKEVDKPVHPDNIKVGREVQGAMLNKPRIGHRFYVGVSWSTSPVQDVLDENTFKTLNSIYKIEEINKPKSTLTKEQVEIGLQFFL